VKTLVLAAIRWSVILTALTVSLFSIRPAQGYIVTLDQVGSNVVATGSGAINLRGLTFTSLVEVPAYMRAEAAIISLAGGIGDGYQGFSGPSSFGSGSDTFASHSSGDFVGIDNFFAVSSVLWVPEGYVSGGLLSSSSTYTNATFTSLGVIPGTYVWRWGTGLPNQNLTLIIGGVGVPDGGTTIFLLSLGLVGLTALGRKLSC
jgi:hypothetical protein